MFSELEIRHFQVFGFVVLRGGLSPKETAQLRDSYERVMAGAPRRDTFGQGGTRCLLNVEDHDPFLASLVARPQVMEAAEAIWGRPCMYVVSDMWSNLDDTPWHCDGTPGEMRPFMKVTYYLDETSAQGGALRLLPGTHRQDRSAELFSLFGQYVGGKGRLRLAADEVPGQQVVATSPGDIVFWNNSMWHHAPKRADGRPRRALFFTYGPDPLDNPLDRRHLMQFISSIRQAQQRPSLYSHTLLEQGGSAVQRMAHRLEELGVEQVRPEPVTQPVSCAS